MAIDETARKSRTAKSGIGRLAGSVAQPGGMNIDWMKVRAAGAVIAGIALLHGVRRRSWRYIHTFGVVVGVAAAGATILQNKHARASQRSDNE